MTLQIRDQPLQPSNQQGSAERGVEDQDEQRKRCAQDVFFFSASSLSEHAVRLHGATFTGEDAHLADHKGAAVVKTNMELEVGASYKISNLLLVPHVHNDRGYAVVRYYSNATRDPRGPLEGRNDGALLQAMVNSRDTDV